MASDEGSGKWRPQKDYFATNLQALLIEIVQFSLEAWGTENWNVFLDESLAPVIETLSTDLLHAQPKNARDFAVDWILAHAGTETLDDNVLHVLLGWSSSFDEQPPSSRTDSCKTEHRHPMTHCPDDPVDCHGAVFHAITEDELLEPLVQTLARQQAELTCQKLGGLLTYEAFDQMWSKYQRHNSVVEKLWCSMDKLPNGQVTKRSFFRLLGFDCEDSAVNADVKYDDGQDGTNILEHFRRLGIRSARSAFRHLGHDSRLSVAEFISGFTRDAPSMEECASRVGKKLAVDGFLTFDAFKRFVSHFLSSSTRFHASLNTYHLHAVLLRMRHKTQERGIEPEHFFREICAEKNESFSEPEFIAAMRALDCQLSDKEMKQIFYAMDRNNDRKVSVEEFTRAMTLWEEPSPALRRVSSFVRCLALERLHAFFQEQRLDQLNFEGLQLLLEGTTHDAANVWQLLGGHKRRSLPLDAVYRSLPIAANA